jgi:type IV pilus assembly protein PilW
MRSDNRYSTHNQDGFSLVEILVGLVIGLLASLVIMQVFTVFEGQKRTTTGSADAQTNGSIALYTIGHELQMAGYSLLPVTDSPLECNALTFGATGITDISPVTITDGGAGAGASDSISIRYGDSASGGVPAQITGVGLTGNANDVTVDNNLGCQVGDVTLVTNGTSCALSSATALSGTTIVTLADITGAIVNANLSCLGTWNVAVLRVNPNYDPADPANSQAYLERNGTPSVADIVNIQAQYGISASAGSNLVTQWVNATGGWAAPSVADRNRIKAVRIAVVARNGLLEKDIVTELRPNGKACSSLTATSPVGLCSWDATSASPTTASPAPEIDLTNDPDWQHYRYRVFETIIPLRNMIWSKETL